MDDQPFFLSWKFCLLYLFAVALDGSYRHATTTHAIENAVLKDQFWEAQASVIKLGFLPFGLKPESKEYLVLRAQVVGDCLYRYGREKAVAGKIAEAYVAYYYALRVTYPIRELKVRYPQLWRDTWDTLVELTATGEWPDKERLRVLYHTTYGAACTNISSSGEFGRSFGEGLSFFISIPVRLFNR